MDLKIFAPREVKFTFRKVKMEYNLKPFTLGVQGWLSSNFKEAQITDIMMGKDIKNLCVLFTKLLDNESKIHLRDTVTLKMIDDDGVESQITNLSDKIMLIAESDELENMLRAILESRGIAMPDEAREKELSEGKNQGE